MNARTVDLMSRCQATIRRREVTTGLGWLRGRNRLHCYKRPFHRDAHSYEERA